MSAFLVNDYHINVLANWAVMYRGSPFYFTWLGRFCKADNVFYVADVLFAQNLRSVNARYGTSDGRKPKLERFMPDLSPVQVIQATHCLMYQSCETNDWFETEAYAICQAIVERATRKVQGYENAEWELTDPGQRPVSIMEIK